MIEETNKARHAKVKGELWLVPTETLLKTDMVEGNGVMYERILDKVFVGTETIPCFMYLGMKSFWRDKDTADNPRMMQDGKPYHFYNEKIAERLSLQ